MNAGNRRASTHLISFLSGVALAVLIAGLGNSDRQLGRTHQAEPRLPQPTTSAGSKSSEEARERAGHDSRSRVDAGIATETGRTRLRADLFEFVASDTPLGSFVELLSDEQASALTRQLEDFDRRILAHERRELKVVSETDTEAKLHIPPFSGDGAERAQFQKRLSAELGGELAKTFMEVSRRDLLQRFRSWGQAERTFTIDLSSDPPVIEEALQQRFEGIPSPALRSLHTYYPDDSRYADLFQLLNE